MELVEPNKGISIAGIIVPTEVYWVLQAPTPLAGMKYPRSHFPWSSLKAVGFSQVVSLHPGSYDPTPLARAFNEQLQDLVGGGPPHT